MTDKPKSILYDMAERYGVEPAAFEAIVRATCSPAPKKDSPPRPLSKEEFAAFLLVAKQYNLNPLTREIFAYPKRGGGVVPVVSVDGWVNLVNSHPQSDGFTFDVEHDAKGALISISCTQYRKDKSHATPVTEYLVECIRDTEPWKMKHRMLRHKSFVQSSRYTYGFAGIYDQDEGEKIAEASEPYEPPAPPPPVEIEHKPEIPMEIIKPKDQDEAMPLDKWEEAFIAAVPILIGEEPPAPPPPPPPPVNIIGALEDYYRAAIDAQTSEALDAAWNDHLAPVENQIPRDEWEECSAIDDRERARIEDLERDTRSDNFIEERN